MHIRNDEAQTRSGEKFQSSQSTQMTQAIQFLILQQQQQQQLIKHRRALIHLASNLNIFQYFKYFVTINKYLNQFEWENKCCLVSEHQLVLSRNSTSESLCIAVNNGNVTTVINAPDDIEELSFVLPNDDNVHLTVNLRHPTTMSFICLNSFNVVTFICLLSIYICWKEVHYVLKYD